MARAAPPLPLAPPLAPQLARAARELPEGPGWIYEPKLDGYRAIVFVAGVAVYVQSRNGKPLGRYFPELVFPAGRYVLDGEIVIDAPGGGESFELLSQRVHPAASRIERLSRETPARFAPFDLLALDDDSLLERPLAERRRAVSGLPEGVALLHASEDPGEAAGWLTTGEGVVAKDLAAPYLPGMRRGMVKVRRRRTIDCVLIGWREHAHGGVGALILGLYDEGGELRPVGHCAGFTASRRAELSELVAPLDAGVRQGGEPSRWSAGRDADWHALRPERVVEVAFDHQSGGRIRHGATLQRLRPDRDPRSCRLEQLTG